jgi:hypothetical protein
VAGSPARRLVLVASSIAALAAPAASSASGGRERDPFALTPRVAHLAQVIVPTAVRSRPDAGRWRQGLGTEARWGGGPVRLLVLRSKLDRRGRRWLRVRLPERPNDRAGWIRADHTRMRRTAWRVVISTAARAVEVRRTGLLLGPWALHLTAHSNVLDDYGGGEGRVAIHGRSGALLSDPLGSARSHGCIRLDNAAVSWLARRAIEGTPVAVRD